MDDCLIKEPADVLQIIELFKKQKIVKGDLLSMLETSIAEVRDMVLTAVEVVNWRQWFLRTGFIVYSILSEYKFDELHFAKFLLGKHKLYGMKPLLGWRELGILMRLDSKVARLINITNSQSGVNLGDETVEDTLKDSLGYCILGYLLTCQNRKEK